MESQAGIFELFKPAWSVVTSSIYGYNHSLHDQQSNLGYQRTIDYQLEISRNYVASGCTPS